MRTRFQVSSGTLWNAFWNAFGTRLERVRHANGTQMERERSVRLFLSSTVRSFLGLANYCAHYISHFATIVEPLRHLTRAGVKWSWTSVHQKAFDSVKSILTIDCVMSHFDPLAETQLKVDASPFGLGAVLLQGSGDDVRPIAYASCTLTDVERRYSQTEREALAVVWACERFHIYLFGQEFKLYTDHKALEVIYSPRSKPPPRIERWSLRLQHYRFTIHHMPGQHNLPMCYQGSH